MTSEDCESLLQRIVFGDLSPRCQRDRRREWLWTAKAVSVLDNYHPYVDQSGFSKSERAQFPYIGRHAHIAVAKGIGKQDWGNQPRLTWEDLTRLCDIVDEIDREADSEIEDRSSITSERLKRMRNRTIWLTGRKIKLFNQMRMQPMNPMVLTLIGRKGKPTRNDGGSAIP